MCKIKMLTEIETVNEMVHNAFNDLNNGLNMHIHEMGVTMGLYTLDGITHGLAYGAYDYMFNPINNPIYYIVKYNGDVIYNDNNNDITPYITQYK